MKFNQYIKEANQKHIINGTMKKKINNEIFKYLKPTYFDKIPLQPLFDILDKHGLIPLQEDQTYWDGFLVGGVSKTERVEFALGIKSFKDEFNRYPVITNAELQLTYYKMPQSGKYEIIAYVG